MLDSRDFKIQEFNEKINKYTIFMMSINNNKD